MLRVCQLDYRSNLEAPDLRPYFKHIHERVEPNSQGHTVISDFADKANDDPVFGVHKRCWFWTLDEAAILYNCAKQFGGYALDIGSHTGWTTSYLAEAGCSIIDAVDPMYLVAEFSRRASENLNAGKLIKSVWFHAQIASEYFLRPPGVPLDVVVIDGNHSEPIPLNDARFSAMRIAERGLILLHDYRGWPIKEAYHCLLDNGFQGKTYRTPNGVAVCWRGEFTPPEHVHDPGIAEV